MFLVWKIVWAPNTGIYFPTVFLLCFKGSASIPFLIRRCLTGAHQHDACDHHGNVSSVKILFLQLWQAEVSRTGANVCQCVSHMCTQFVNFMHLFISAPFFISYTPPHTPHKHTHTRTHIPPSLPKEKSFHATFHFKLKLKHCQELSGISCSQEKQGGNCVENTDHLISKSKYFIWTENQCNKNFYLCT